ncbi:hypothetical protein [Streptomyces sp. NPDC059491]|uniref:hypothetical protein n=1 Tax=Streptomyces sp. NPDC059491 TaxID=3346850 RepID=UPI00367D99EC
MAKERITVCLPACEPAELRQAIERAMAPYRYEREDMPADWVGEWDYWYVSGAGCEFPVVAGHEGDPRLVREELELSTGPRVLPPGLCDGGPRGLLDFEAARRPAAEQAERNWADWHELAAAHPPAQPFGVFRDRWIADPAGRSHGDVWAEYAAQPAIRALHDRPELRDRVGSQPQDRLGADRAAYVAREAAEVLPTPALLTLDGTWVGIAGDERRTWFNTYLDGLPPEAVVVRVLYHG